MKVVIIGGAGGIGSSVAFNLLLLGDLCDVVLVDIQPHMITSHVMDFEQTVVLSGAHSVRGGNEAEVLDSDVVVMCASVPLRLNSSRSVFLNDNAAIVNRICDLLVSVEPYWNGVLIMVTNPVDPLCTWMQRRTGINRRRILGYTLNDSLRLRTGIGQALNVSPQGIDAWVLGEHGDSSVPLFGRVKVGGVPVVLTAEQRRMAQDYMRSWYVRHVALDSGRTSTWTSGLGIARMIASIAHGNRDLWPASVVLAGEYGIEGVSVSVPVSLGRDGAEEIIEWEIASEEHAALHVAASRVREMTNAINIAKTT